MHVFYIVNKKNRLNERNYNLLNLKSMFIIFQFTKLSI